MPGMTEQLERISEDPDAITAHILADLHDQRRALAELCAAVSRIEQLLAELAPAARRAAAMLDNPVQSYMAARRAAAADADPAPRRRFRNGKDPK
jgi:ABC-type transporter Mla subunit MlaD